MFHHLERGNILYHQRRYVDAEKEYFKLLAQDPNNPFAMAMLAQVYIETERKTAALEYAHQALQNAPRQVFKIAESLGGVESMANHPVTMTHGAMKLEDRQRLGISAGLVRLSVGVEGTKDIVADVKYALEVMKEELVGELTH